MFNPPYVRTYVPCVYRFKAVVDTDRFVVKTFDRRVSVSSYRTPVPSDTYLEMLQEVSELMQRDRPCVNLSTQPWFMKQKKLCFC